MGLFDSMLGNVLGQAGNSGALGALLNSPLAAPLLQSLPAKFDSVLATTPYGSIEGFLSALQQAGLGDQVQSWISTGANLPVTTDQITSILGNERIAQLAGGLGLSADTLPTLMSEYLPILVDRMSPNGVLVPPNS